MGDNFSFIQALKSKSRLNFKINETSKIIAITKFVGLLELKLRASFGKKIWAAMRKEDALV